MSSIARTLAPIIALVCVVAAHAPSNAQAPRIGKAPGSMYDEARLITLKGKVIKWQNTAPTAVLIISTVGVDERGEAKKGFKMSWAIEGAGSMPLRRRGISNDTFTQGMDVTVKAYAPSDIAYSCGEKRFTGTQGYTCMAGARRVTLANGCSAFLGWGPEDRERALARWSNPADGLSEPATTDCPPGLPGIPIPPKIAGKP